jgi:hypothetical protein
LPVVNYSKAMKRIINYSLALLFVVGTAQPLSAQVDSVIRALIDNAARQRATPPPRTRSTQQRQTAPKESSKRSIKRFDGTWLATESKSNSQEQQTITRILTMVIKDGKATKTLETTNASTPEKPFYANTYELQRKWTYSSIDCTEQGTSLTIQWTAGQLADWNPKTIPNNLVTTYGSPNPETSVYTLKGDELTRVNDANGVVYKRAK